MKHLLAAVVVLTTSAAQAATPFKPLKSPNQSIIRVNINCGIPPIPPLGCRVGPCQCDASGQLCQWTFICG